MCLETSEPLQNGLALTQCPAVTKQMPASKVTGTPLSTAQCCVCVLLGYLLFFASILRPRREKL